MNITNEATRLVCLEAAQKLRTYVGIYTGDKQARRLIDELSNIADALATSAAPGRSAAPVADLHAAIPTWQERMTTGALAHWERKNDSTPAEDAMQEEIDALRSRHAAAELVASASKTQSAPVSAPTAGGACSASPAAEKAGGLSAAMDGLILIRAAAKDMYNKTYAETRLRLTSDDMGLRDAATAAGKVFVAALDATNFADSPTAADAGDLSDEAIASESSLQIRCALEDERDEIKANAELHAILAQYPPESWAVRNRAFEEAAALAVQWGNARVDDGGGYALRNCAEAIRALKSDKHTAMGAAGHPGDEAAIQNMELVVARLADIVDAAETADCDLMESSAKDALPCARTVLEGLSLRPTASAGGLPAGVAVEALQGEHDKQWHVIIKHPFGTSWIRMADIRDEKLAELISNSPAASGAVGLSPIPRGISSYLDAEGQPQNSYRPAPAGAGNEAQEAARYRWLRDKSNPGICAFYLSVGKAFDGVKFNQATVDEAIDAQIAADRPTANGAAGQKGGT